MDTTFKLRVDDGFLVRVKSYAEREKKSASEVFRDGAKMLMDDGVNDGVRPELVVSSKSGVNPVVEQLRAKMGGSVVRASELGEVEVLNKPFGDVPSSVVGSSKFRGIKAIAFEKFDRLLEMSTDAGAKEILSIISGLEDRIDSL
jgi:hypothetical protein